MDRSCCIDGSIRSSSSSSDNGGGSSGFGSSGFGSSGRYLQPIEHLLFIYRSKAYASNLQEQLKREKVYTVYMQTKAIWRRNHNIEPVFVSIQESSQQLREQLETAYADLKQVRSSHKHSLLRL